MSRENPTCEDVRAALYALVDCEECAERTAAIDAGIARGPNAEERVLLLAHATGCPQCSELLAAERHLRLFLRGCLEEEVPEGMAERIVMSLSSVSIRARVEFE